MIDGTWLMGTNGANNNYSPFPQVPHKAIVDHTSPALYTPITPGSDGMVPSAARRYLHAANASECIANGVETAPSPRDFVSLPEEDRVTAIIATCTEK